MRDDGRRIIEQRRFGRKELRGPIRIVSEGATVMYATLIDLSESGIGVMLARPICPDREYEFEFEVLLDKTKRAIRVLGTPIESTSDGAAGLRTGIRISEVAPASLTAFIQFMEC